MRYGIGRAGLDAVAAEDAAVVIDVVNLGVALAPADTQRVGVLGGLDVNTISGAGGGAQKTGDALFQAVFIALQLMDTAVALLEFWRCFGIILGERRTHHLLERHAHAFGNRSRAVEHF